MTGNWVDIEEITGRGLKIITNNGKNGIIQSKLWKELDLSSKDGSRVALFLERRSLIRRVKFFENGHWTYKLLPTKSPISLDCIESAPCLSCPVEHMCSIDGIYSPHNCRFVEDWIKVSFHEKTQSKQKIGDSAHQESWGIQFGRPSKPANSSKQFGKYKKTNLSGRQPNK